MENYNEKLNFEEIYKDSNENYLIMKDVTDNA